MIPPVAIEAAHRAWREQAALDGSIFEYNLRAAIEAAAPFIAAAAWDEGEEAGQDNSDSNRGHNIEHKYNPYRK